MIKRLFIDVDDTLILYNSDSKINPYGFWNGDPFEPNFGLINAIGEYREAFPDAMIVIWSGGGRDYARAAADHLFPDNDFAYMEKGWDSFPLVRDTDIVVDDADFSLGNHSFKVYSPIEGDIVIRDEIKTKAH